MKQVDNLLSQGLKDWVDQGGCPPEVAERIRSSIRELHRPPRWRRWAALAGSVAVVAAVFVLVFATQPQVAHQFASVPILGALAAQLVEPDFEFHADPKGAMTASLFRPTRQVDLAAEAEADGLTLSVETVATDGQVMQIRYTARGKGLLLPADQAALLPEVRTAAGLVECQSLTADKRGDAIRFVLFCEGVPDGEEVSLTLPALPAEGGGSYPALTATFTN